MNIVCGTDIVEVERIKNAIENLGDKFLNEIFTENEIKYCEKKGVQKYQSYAGRFATKEAAFKALNNTIGINNCNWKMFEVENENNGKPKLIVHFDNKNVKCLDVSISHCKEYASANVVGILK